MQYKTSIIEKLENWAETFNNNYPDHLEEKIEEEANAYNSIKDLIENIEVVIALKKNMKIFYFIFGK